MKTSPETTLPSNERNVGKNLLENMRRKECIQCSSQKLKLFFAIEQEERPPEYSHVIIVLCPNCKRGQVERTYCDSTNGEDLFVHTEWYLLDKDSVDRLGEFIRQHSADGVFQKRFTPCPKPLSPQCLCAVHWQLSEAAERLEPLTDKELLEQRGVVSCTFTVNEEGLPKFERSH